MIDPYGCGMFGRVTRPLRGAVQIIGPSRTPAPTGAAQVRPAGRRIDRPFGHDRSLRVRGVRTGDPSYGVQCRADCRPCEARPASAGRRGRRPLRQNNTEPLPASFSYCLLPFPYCPNFPLSTVNCPAFPPGSRGSGRGRPRWRGRRSQKPRPRSGAGPGCRRPCWWPA